VEVRYTNGTTTNGTVIHVEMIVKQHLKGKGEEEKTDDTFGYVELKANKKEYD
jgi:hypothetical protein